jgi:hypothetical protein
MPPIKRDVPGGGVNRVDVQDGTGLCHLNGCFSSSKPKTFLEQAMGLRAKIKLTAKLVQRLGDPRLAHPSRLCIQKKAERTVCLIPIQDF